MQKSDKIYEWKWNCCYVTLLLTVNFFFLFYSNCFTHALVTKAILWVRDPAQTTNLSQTTEILPPSTDPFIVVNSLSVFIQSLQRKIAIRWKFTPPYRLLNYLETWVSEFLHLPQRSTSRCSCCAMTWCKSLPGSCPCPRSRWSQPQKTEQPTPGWPANTHAAGKWPKHTRSTH